MFIAGAAALLLAALAVDVWDRHNGRDPRQRKQVLQSRTEQGRTRKGERAARRLGADAIEAQFRPPPDDHDIAPSRRRIDRG
jgi:hypothetical protein